MTRHNKFREGFYNQVIENAKQLEGKRVGNILVRRYSYLRRLAMHRSIKRHLSVKYLMIHQTPHLHGVRTSLPILPFNNSNHFFGHRRPIIWPKESRRQSPTTMSHLLFSRSMTRIQQPSDSRSPAKNGPFLTNFAMHSGDHIVSLCSHSSSQQLAKFLSSRLLSRKTFRREWSRAHWSLFSLTQISGLTRLRTS